MRSTNREKQSDRVMATKKTTAVRKVLKNASQDSSNLASGNDDSCANNSGAKRKTKPSGTIVKSRYMQTEKKSVVKKTTPNESVLVPPRPASPKVASGHKPPRRTLHVQPDQNCVLIPSLLESSNLGGNVLQSTILDGHCMRPDFDLSVIKANASPASQPSAADPNAKNRNLALETFLLAFLTAKIESNTQKLKEEAERNLITLMEEEEKLRSSFMNKKQKCLLLEKQQQLNDLLDQQIDALTPVAATAKKFTEEYKTFASAIDTTRHELPIKNLHIEGDREEFLDKAVACLNQSQCILEEYTKDVSTESESTAACLKEIKSAAHEINQHLLSTSSDLLELSSLVSQETVLVQQCLEEDKIGFNTAQSLFSE
ncbi:HAUS augmin-like complex subunit 8 isoform X2 [Hemibagrus wyckioides]|uniref:HAUS augmin-like complex subunit 8 isoform X2 n=1 Tax=Hemibagrus wyckioides TaxID=337641 RepID=UPI00266C9904|nr:HAUS augmin-like complex subunit 8 isoform X2 [Hemibagrus wyckioides]